MKIVLKHNTFERTNVLGTNVFLIPFMLNNEISFQEKCLCE